MSKLNVECRLAETQIRTDACSARVKITPMDNTATSVQFGWHEPCAQVLRAADLRELAGIFLEVAELLEGGNKPQEKVAKPEKGTRAVRVKLVTDAKDPTLHGVFSELTDKQAEALEHAILVMNAALPWGMHIYTTD